MPSYVVTFQVAYEVEAESERKAINIATELWNDEGNPHLINVEEVNRD